MGWGEASGIRELGEGGDGRGFVGGRWEIYAAVLLRLCR